MPIKVTFDFGKKQIVVEGDEGDLIRVAQEAKAIAPLFSEIRILSESSPAITTPSEQPISGVTPSKGSLRQFAKGLTLSNSYERIAAIAYYATKFENKNIFSIKEMNDWFGLCGFQKPSIMPVALSDARRKYGYVENKGRDQWALSTSGENLIMGIIEKQLL